MIPNDDPTDASWWQSRKLRPKYSLSEFSRPEYTDPVVPVQILLVMMGFCVALLNQADFSEISFSVKSISLVCGIIYIIAYMFYLTEYYEKLWAPYFLLPEDKLFFRIYSLLVGVVVISLMSKWPGYWSFYILALFLVMFDKKRRTRSVFHDAVISQFGSYENCSDGKIKSQFVLVDTFTWNFLYLGIITLVPFAVIMCGAAFFTDSPDALIWLNTKLATDIALENIYAVNVGTNILVTLFTVAFWSSKITSGLRTMRDQIEEGYYEYFEVRDLRSRLRRRRYAP